ncbi:MAG: glycosyltransferase family 4 protein, partial [Hyphomicrobiaceae bacterium]
KISVIANPVAKTLEEANPAQAGPNGRFSLIAVGRLETQKGYDLLIPAFATLAGRFPDWDLAIYGEGPARKDLESLIGETGMARRVVLNGLTREVEKALAASHAMALPSRFEGFPNALTEAMAAGLPAVAFDGVADDLILDGETGLRASFADPVASLAACLERLMADGELRVRLGAAARARVAAFSPEVHNARWDELLRRVAGKTESQ